MQVQVETYMDEGGAERLRRFCLDSRVIEVADNMTSGTALTIAT